MPLLLNPKTAVSLPLSGRMGPSADESTELLPLLLDHTIRCCYPQLWAAYMVHSASSAGSTDAVKLDMCVLNYRSCTSQVFDLKGSLKVSLYP